MQTQFRNLCSVFKPKQCALGRLFAPAAAALIPRPSIKMYGYFPRDVIAKLTSAHRAQEMSTRDDGYPHRTALFENRSENEHGEGHQKGEGRQR